MGTSLKISLCDAKVNWKVSSSLLNVRKEIYLKVQGCSACRQGTSFCIKISTCENFVIDNIISIKFSLPEYDATLYIFWILVIDTYIYLGHTIYRLTSHERCKGIFDINTSKSWLKIGNLKDLTFPLGFNLALFNGKLFDLQLSTNLYA